MVGATRQGGLGQADSGLDHFWTNSPAKVSQIYTQYNGSDHKVILGVRYSKMIRNRAKYVKKEVIRTLMKKNSLSELEIQVGGMYT